MGATNDTRYCANKKCNRALFKSFDVASLNANIKRAGRRSKNAPNYKQRMCLQSQSTTIADDDLVQVNHASSDTFNNFSADER